jgi:hypothetical protein
LTPSEAARAAVVQRASRQHEAVAGQGRAAGGGDLLGDQIVALHLVLAAPAVEQEAGRHRTVGGLDEDRAGVAQPDVAKLAADDLDGGVGQPRAGGGLGLVADHHQAHAFAAGTGQGARQGGDLVLGLVEVFTPDLGVAGEAHPHGAVRSPLGGDGRGHGGNLDRNGRRKWAGTARGSSRSSSKLVRQKKKGGPFPDRPFLRIRPK